MLLFFMPQEGIKGTLTLPHEVGEWIISYIICPSSTRWPFGSFGYTAASVWAFIFLMAFPLQLPLLVAIFRTRLMR